MKTIPLSEILRPKSFKEVVGQEEIIDSNSFLQKSIKNKRPLSILLFGPPGTGKTTIAKLYANSFKSEFITLSAVFSGVSDIKKIIEKAKNTLLLNTHTILFVDEIHRFNKAQQDSFLPFVEDGTIILIGATTENPSFSLNNALLSRLRVLKLNSLKNIDLEKIINHYESNKKELHLSIKAKNHLINISNGDARHLLNMIENIENIDKAKIDIADIDKIIQKKPALYDRASEEHYNLISALHKSVRGSDPDAALYWLCRMLNGGEDPKYIARRIIRIAIEDISLADPQALNIAMNAYNTYHMLGSPEGELALAQAVIYLALAPKSNAAYIAYEKASKLAQNSSHLPPPHTILNAPTKLMKDWGYSQGYIYDHDEKDGFSGQNYFPKDTQRQEFYHPIERGFERDMKKRLEYFKKLRKIKDST